MGLSLKKLWDQANLFDGGRSYKTQVTAPERARNTLQAQQANLLRVTRNAQQSGTPQQKQAANRVLNNKSWTLDNSYKPAYNNNAFKNATGEVGLGLYRSALGTGQGLSGMYDLATPGTGTNRFSQSLDVRAKRADELAKQQGKDGFGYKGAQFLGDALTFTAGGAAFARGASMLGKAPVGKLATTMAGPISKPLGKATASLASKGAGGRIAAAGIRGITAPGNIANVATDTGFGLGQMASKGIDIGPEDVALQAGLSTAFGVGLPMTAQSVKELAIPTAKAGKVTAKAGKAVVKSQINAPGALRQARANEAVARARVDASFQKLSIAKTNGRPYASLERQYKKDLADYAKARAIAKAAEINNKKPGLYIEDTSKGAPIEKTYYHGSSNPEIKEFNINKAKGGIKVDALGSGVYLTPDKNVAKKYGDNIYSIGVGKDTKIVELGTKTNWADNDQLLKLKDSLDKRGIDAEIGADGTTLTTKHGVIDANNPDTLLSAIQEARRGWDGGNIEKAFDDAGINGLMNPKRNEVVVFDPGKAKVTPPKSPAPIEKTPNRAQAITKLQVAAIEAPPTKTPNDLPTGGVDEVLATIDRKNKLMLASMGETVEPRPTVKQPKPAPKPKVTVKKTVETPAPTEQPNVVKSNEPEMSFVERQAAAQADKEAQILKPRGVEAVRSKWRDVSSKLYNPYSEAERLNQRNAQAQGLSRTGATKKLDATSDLASKMDFVANSRVAAKQLMEDTGLDKVIQKYPDKKGKVNEFVLYLAAKRDVAVSGAKGKRIYGGETLEDVNKFITDFEARNPQARTDLEAVKGSFRKLLDDELAAGTITPEFHKNAIATEDYYAPIERVLGSDEVLRPSVNVNNKASLSRTSATRKLEGSDDPVKGDWDAIIGGMQRRVRETKLNQAYGVMYDIAKNKRIDDAVRMGMTKEQSKALIDLQDTITSLQKQAQAAKGAVKSAGKKVRVASKKMTAYQNKVNDKAIERIARNLEVNDVDGAATVRGLKRSDRNQLMSWLQGNMTDAEITNGIKKSAQLQDAVARLQEARAIADDLQTTGTLFKGARSELIQATDAKGRQVIRGFVDGYPTWLEVTPEIAKMVQGLEPQRMPGLIKGLASVQRVWRTFWTGAYNPVFAVKSFLLYDPPMAAINQSGSRFQLDPRVAGKAIADTFTDYDGFFKELKRTGVQPVYGSKMSGDIKLDAKVIASHKNFQSRLAYLATHPGQLIEALDVVGGKLAHSTRMRTARAEYAKSISQGLSKNVAIENAARAYNNVLPNYSRVSKLTKEIDAIIPYASAGVAGNRALTTAMKADPVGWAAKAGLFATAIAATGEYALGSDETKEFYQDMYDSGKVSVLQNNIVFALPGAKKNPETGEWTGIVKIAIPPEFRAPNALLQQALADNNQVDTGSYDPRLGAATMAGTAGITSISRSGGISAEYNPAIQAGLELTTNRQGGTGDSFAYGDNQYLPRNDQINDNTSQLAISGAQAWNKLPFGDVSPAAVDAQLKGLGMGGNVIRSVGSQLTKNENTTPEQLPGTGLSKTVKGLYSADGTKGMTETGWHFKHQDQVMNSLPSKVLRDQFSIVNSKNDSPGDAQAKSQLLYESLQSDGALWDAQKKQNDLDATKTGISNPLFGLTPEQARAVTLYRGNSRLTAAKQTYAKDGSSLFESLGLDEKWYQDFKKKEDAFYKKLESKKKDSDSASVATTAKTYSGNPYQEPSRVIQSKLDYYYTLPKGTGARTAFLKANPDVVQYWDQQNGLANEERLAMGLDLLSTDNNKYSSYGSYGSGGSSDPSLNPLKYALPLSAGGKFKSPVASKGKAVKLGIKKKDTIAKPKVSIKKSMV